MRITWVAVVVALAVLGGCAAETKRAEKAERLSASRLDGKFQHDDPLVQMLSPSERGALDRAGMLAPLPEGVELDENGEVADGSEGDEQKTTSEKAGEVMMSVLSVGITLGMMAAPYLLF